ncbi:MAG: YitT family protein, partial [Clostridia bacterium]
MNKANKFLKKLALSPWNFVMLILAGAINATGVILLLYPAHVIDGGISGLSQFIATQTGLHISIFLICLNVPLFFLGFRKMGIKFIIYSLTSICMYSLMSYLYQRVFFIGNAIYELVHSDMLLCSIFGGVISGLGSGLTIRYGGAIDGVEVMAVMYAKKVGLSVGQFVMVFNMIVYVVASIIIKDLRVGCYSIVAYALGLQVVDFVVDGFDKGKACTIITKNADILATAISKELGRGITVIDSKGFYSHEENTMLYCVVNRFEIIKLKSLINSIDPKAFVAINDISEVLGNRIKFSLRKQAQEKNEAYFPEDISNADGLMENAGARDSVRECAGAREGAGEVRDCDNDCYSNNNAGAGNTGA